VPISDPTVTDSDKDGYTDYDERANGTDECSAASKPADFNHNNVSDVLDQDDDSDGIGDATDQLFFDANNGAATVLPLSLEWSPTAPALGGVERTGFTGSQISTNGPVDQATQHAIVRTGIHAVDAGGHLTLWTYPGTAQGSTNSQTNALQIGFDSSSAFKISTRIVQPFTGITPAVGHVGGIFFGPNQDNYVRLALIGTASGGQAVQVAIEVGGAFTEKARVDLSGITISNLDIVLVGDPVAHTITAYYDVNTSGTLTALGAAVAAPAAWFSDNTGAARNTSLTGYMLSNGSAAQMAFGFDFFRVERP